MYKNGILTGEQIMKMYIFNCDCNECNSEQLDKIVNESVNELVNKENIYQKNYTIFDKNLPIKKRKFCQIN